MNIIAVEVIIEDNKKHPYCSHGPTLLFLRNKDSGRKFFACAACRDRKDCSFFLWEDELPKFSDVKKQFWDSQRLQFLKQLPSHKDLFLKFHKVSIVITVFIIKSRFDFSKSIIPKVFHLFTCYYLLR